MPPVVVDPLLLLAAGLAIDALFGDMPALFTHIPHPIVLAGRGVAFFDRKLNREIRSQQSRRTRGIITVIVRRRRRSPASGPRPAAGPVSFSRSEQRRTS